MKKVIAYAVIAVVAVVFAFEEIQKGSDKWFLAVLILCAMCLYEVSHRKSK